MWFKVAPTFMSGLLNYKTCSAFPPEANEPPAQAKMI
jgi:hypothetical protein